MPTFDEIESIYKKLIGYMPPRMKARVQRGLRLDPKFTEMVETLRDHAVAPKALDLKTSQLIAFGILLNNHLELYQALENMVLLPALGELGEEAGISEPAAAQLAS